MSKKPPAPSHLDAAAKALWQEIKAEYSVDDPAGLALLTSACESHQRARQCREQIDKEGLTIDGRLNPLLGVERDRQRSFVTTLHELGLDIEPSQPMGRPVSSTVRRVK